MDNGTLCEPSAGTFHLYEPVAAGIAAAITFHDGTASRVALKPDVYSILTLATFRECQWISAGTPAGNQLERLLNEVTPNACTQVISMANNISTGKMQVESAIGRRLVGMRMSVYIRQKSIMS